MVVTAEAFAASRAHFEALSARGVVIEALAERSLRGALIRLAARDVVTLLVEGGPTLHRAFAEAGLVDRMQLIVAPHALGYGVPAFAMPAGTSLARKLGDDFLVEFDVHGTGGSDRTH